MICSKRLQSYGVLNCLIGSPLVLLFITAHTPWLLVPIIHLLPRLGIQGNNGLLTRQDSVLSPSFVEFSVGQAAEVGEN